MFIKPAISRVLIQAGQAIREDREDREEDREAGGEPRPRVPQRRVYRDRISRIIPSRDRVSRIFPSRDRVSRIIPSRDRVSRIFTRQHWTTRADPGRDESPARRRTEEDPERDSPPGCNICGMCRVCTCLHYDFLKTPIGLIKLAEIILATFLYYTLATHAKPEYISKLGLGYSLLSLVNSACILTTAILILCYNFSSTAFKQIRPSVFEVVFTGLSSLVFAFASFLMSRRVFSQFFHYYRENPTHEAYPAFTRAYGVGYGLAVVLLLDGILAYRKMKSDK